jgi:hypothetical protein
MHIDIPRCRRNPLPADGNRPGTLGETRSETCTLAPPYSSLLKTWISLDNIGNDSISMVTVFSAPGFEDFMRAGSVHEGEKNVPLTQAENDQIDKAHSRDVIYKEP